MRRVLGVSNVAVLVVDDHRMFAESLVRLLEDEPDIEAVGAVGSVREAQAVASDHRPDIVLFDTELPDGTGVDVAMVVKRAHPDAKLVILTGDDDDSLLRTAIDSGCVGLFTTSAATFATNDRLNLKARLHLVHGLQLHDPALQRHVHRVEGDHADHALTSHPARRPAG